MNLSTVFRVGGRAIVASLVLSPCFLQGLAAQDLPSKIERYLNAQVLKNRFSGTVIVAHGKEVLVEKSIGPSPATGAVTRQTQERTPVGSVAEQFLAASMLQLEKAGKLQLDSSICEFLSSCPGDWNAIHLRHLLAHSSGLPIPESLFSCDQNSSPVPGGILAALSRKPLLFKPGDRFNDNKLDYVFLRLVIEKVSGQSTQKFLEETIFHPLKLKQTGYPVSRKNSPPSGQGQDCRQREDAADALSSLFFAGEMYSTAHDLFRWQRALATDGFLPKNLRDQMLVPYVEGHGFGWKIIKEFDRKVALQSNGGEPASVSIRNYPDDEMCIIVVSRVGNVSSATVSHDLGALLFGKHYPVSTEPGSKSLP